MPYQSVVQWIRTMGSLPDPQFISLVVSFVVSFLKTFAVSFIQVWESSTKRSKLDC